MKLFKKAIKILNHESQLNFYFVMVFLISISVIIGYSSIFNSNLTGTIATFVSLFSGLLFSFTFVIFESAKKKKNELNEILDYLGISMNTYLDLNEIPENQKYHISDINNRLRFMDFSNSLVTLIIILVINSVFIFMTGISLEIRLSYLFLVNIQSCLNFFGLTIYSFLLLNYIYIVTILVIKVYKFYMNELELK